jgi:ribosomal protein S18 acetylase RimI-like enzyme
VLFAVQVAQEWGCKRICLHCDPYNEAASALYSKFGYVKVATQGPSFLWLQMGPGARLQLMQKKLGDAD